MLKAKVSVNLILLMCLVSINAHSAVLVHEGFSANTTNNLSIEGFDGTATSTGLTGVWDWGFAGDTIESEQRLKYSGATWVGTDGGYIPDGVGGSNRTFWEKNNNWGNSLTQCLLSSSIDMTVDGVWYMSFFSKSNHNNAVIQVGLNNGTNELMWGNGFAGAAGSNKGITAYYNTINTSPTTNGNDTYINDGAGGAQTFFWVAKLVKSNSGSSDDLDVYIAGYNLTASNEIDDIDPGSWTREVYLTGVSTVFTNLELKINGGNDGSGANWPAIDEVRIGESWEDVTGVVEPVVPTITTQPESLVVDINDSAVFSVDAASPSGVTYQWFYSVDNQIDDPGDIEVGSDANSYNISSVQAPDEGYYYCKLTNDATLPTGPEPPVYSDVVSLGVRRQVAYWTLDSADFSGGQYLDQIGDNPAVVTGTASFVAGVQNQAVTIDSTDGFASAGIFDPFEHAGQMTILLWFNWSVDDDRWHKLLSKNDGSDSSDYLWELAVTPDGSLSFGGTTQIRSSNTITPGQWIFAAATLDGQAASLYLKQQSSVMMDQFDGYVTLGQKPDATFNIGAGSAGLDAFNGRLDNIEVYNYILTSQDIANRFSAVTGLGVCDTTQNSVFDVSGPNGVADCIVNFYDFSQLAAAWMESGIVITP